MTAIGSKAEIKPLIQRSLEVYHAEGKAAFAEKLESLILKKKVRFPVLEYVGTELYANIPDREQLEITDGIISLQTMGGNVVAGMILQLRTASHFKSSLEKAVDYIIAGDAWYVCDIIGERVMGHALLTRPKGTIPVLKKYTRHPDKWIVRCVGVAIHYAVKKGLNKQDSERSFQILLSCATTTDLHTKKGIGWAAKTIAKFHPDIIALHRKKIDSNPDIKQWFKTKIQIGLGRSFKYAARYPR